MATQVAPTATERILDKGYDASAGLGKIVGIWTAGSGLFFSTVILIIGIVLIFRKNPREVVDAIIKDAECEQLIYTEKNKKKVSYACILNVSFIALDGKTYEGKITSNNKMYTVGETVKVSYLETNPNDMRQHMIRMRTVGFICLGIGLLGIISSSFSLYLTLNYKLYQSAQGVGFATGTAMNAYNYTTTD